MYSSNDSTCINFLHCKVERGHKQTGPNSGYSFVVEDSQTTTEYPNIMNRLYFLIISLCLVAFSPAELLAATKTWVGSMNSNWSNPFNWQPSGIPATSDDIVFTGSSSNQSCNLPATVIVKSISLLPDYSGSLIGNNSPSAILTVQQLFSIESGTVNMNRSRFKSMQLLRINGGNFIKGNDGISSMVNVELLSGSLSFGNGKVEILGSFTMASGNASLGSGTLAVNGAFVQTGGITQKSSGIASFNSTTASVISNSTFNCSASTITFKGLQFNSGNFNGGSGSIYFTAPVSFSSAQVDKASGGWYMNNSASISFLNSPINFGNTIFNGTDLSILNSTVNLGSASILASGSVDINGCQINKSSGDLRLALNDTLNLFQSELSTGTGLFFSNHLNMIESDLSIGSGNSNIFGYTSIKQNSNFVKLNGDIHLSYNSEIELTGSNMDLSGCNLINLGSISLTSSLFNSGASAVLVNGNLEINNDALFNSPTSTLTIKGDFRRINGAFAHNAGEVILSGSSTFQYSVIGQPEFFNLTIEHKENVTAKTIEISGYVTVNNEFSIDNGNSSSRPVRINNGTIRLLGNFDISQYGTVQVNTGNGIVSFVGSGSQTITGGSLIAGNKILPRIEINKAGGEFLINGLLSFGNGFTHENSVVSFDSEAVVCLSGGEFDFHDLLIPRVEVAGVASLVNTTTIMGNLEIHNQGVLLNDNQSINIVSEFRNYGRYQNNSGSVNVSSILYNYGDFAANSGTVNALAGIQQDSMLFSTNAAQVNILGNLAVNGGRFSCNNGLVAISGSVIQNGGEIYGNVGSGAMNVSQNFIQNSGAYMAQNGTLNIAGTLTMNGIFGRGNGTINFNGIGPQAIPSLAYNRLVIGGSGRLITLSPGEIRIFAESGGFVPHASNFYTTTGNTIHFDRSGNQDIPGFAYNSLTVSRTGVKTMLSNASVRSTLQVGNNTTFDADGASNNRIFTLISNSTSTARIAPLSTGASIVGNMNVQRWTRGGIRSNRFLGSPVDTANGIKFKQLKDNVIVLGPGAGANGFDNPTVFTSNLSVYDEALANGSEWRSPANINEVLPTGKGLILFHVGDRSQIPTSNTTIPNAVTLDFKGTPNQGDINLPIQCTGICVESDNGNGWNLLANPYASPIDWMSTDWVRSGVSGTIYIWNPRVNQYASFNLNNPAAATNGGSRYIGPGQAFFLKATSSNPILNINERVKSDQFPDTLLFRNRAIRNQLRLVVSNEQLQVEDEIVLGFDDFASEAFEDAFDAAKPVIPDLALQFSAKNDLGENLSAHIFNQPDLQVNDKIIPLNLKAVNGVYIFESLQLGSFDSGVTFYLKDEYKKTTTKLEEGLKLALEVSSDSASFSENRLKLIIRSNEKQLSIINEMQVWPNPSDGVQINFAVGSQENGELKLFNILGSEVKSFILNASNSGIIQTDISDLSSGIYTAVWTSSSHRLSAKFSKR